MHPLRIPAASDRRRGRLGVDSSAIGRAVSVFERYAAGAVSIDELAREQGMNDRTLNDILKNPIYNGWVVRKGERAAAAWRDSPPVDDVLWAGSKRCSRRELAAAGLGEARFRTRCGAYCTAFAARRSERQASWVASAAASTRPSHALRA